MQDLVMPTDDPLHVNSRNAICCPAMIAKKAVDSVTEDYATLLYDEGMN